MLIYNLCIFLFGFYLGGSWRFLRLTRCFFHFPSSSWVTGCPGPREKGKLLKGSFTGGGRGGGVVGEREECEGEIEEEEEKGGVVFTDRRGGGKPGGGGRLMMK
jgi:hypothetical protein